MTNEFTYFETMADIGVKVTAPDMDEAFSYAAQGVLNLITDIDKIEPVLTKNIKIISEDEYGLLYDWITEILIILSTDDFIGSQYKVDITEIDEGYKLNAQIKGDTYDLNKYNYKTEVKAITYHLMNIKKTDNKIHMSFILDL